MNLNPEELNPSEVLGLLTGSPEGKPARFRVSRPCYDKFRRCPGWAGGGARYAKVRRCDNGYIRYYDDNGTQRLWMWRLHRCPKCGVIVLPYLVRWGDWRWWRWRLSARLADWRYERDWKKQWENWDE